MTAFAQPSAALLSLQSEWLAPARTKLLRKAGIGRRRRVLDLGCGRGDVTAELARRCAGTVIGLDLLAGNLARQPLGDAPPVSFVAGDACRLPFAEGAFDLVFCQFIFLWTDAAQMTREIFRILASGGVLVAIEPDYGGLIEYPPETATRDLWLEVLPRCGAAPTVGRALPSTLCAAGFRCEVDLLDRLAPPAAERFRFLSELDLSAAARQRLREAQAADAATPPALKVAHLPLFLITALRP